MNTEDKPYKYIAVRIIVSVIALLILSFICLAIISEDLHMVGEYDPVDYLGPANTDFSPVILYIGIFIFLMVFVWKAYKLKWLLAMAGSIIALTVCAFIFYSIYYENQSNMLVIHEVGGWTEEINLTAYEPFRENTLAKNLDEAAALNLTDKLPRLDGATALYPLYAAFARAVYPAGEYKVYGEDSIVKCSRTSGAYKNLLEDKADIIYLMGVSEEQRRQADELGLELVLTPVGKEAFVFFVNKQNTISGLTVANIKGIYSGEITNWRGVGGDNSKILAYQRPDSSGSQIMLKEIMGDVPIIEAPGNNYFDEMMGMYMAVAYKNHKNALGYSFRYYINDMVAEDLIRFLPIDGAEPDKDNIASGAYPFAHEFYAVTVNRRHATDDEKARAENIEKFMEWTLSRQGRELVEKTGYVPLP